MGSVLGTAASGVGGLVGNVIALPFNVLSCRGLCSGTWDLLCFIEHFCVTNVIKFILAVILVLFVLYAGYLLCKLGVVKCLAKNACKLAYMPCWVGCRLLRHLWHKVQDTERVYRGRRGRARQQPDPDVELGDLSTSSYDSRMGSSSSDFSGHRGGGAAAAGRSRWDSSSSSSRRKDRIRQSLRPRRAGSKVEHAIKISRESESERRRPHHPRSIGGRRKEEASSVRDHGSAAAARDHSHPHRHSIGVRRKEEEEEASSLRDHGSAARDQSHAHRHSIGDRRKEKAEGSSVRDHGSMARQHVTIRTRTAGHERPNHADSM